MISTVVNRLEEGIIALLLAAMTSLTFVNVIMRYVFNSGLTWALEITEFLFAWLILFGMSYGVKVGSHIGVDALVRLFPNSAVDRLSDHAGWRRITCIPPGTGRVAHHYRKTGRL